MEKVKPPRREGWPGKAAGDKGYSYPRVREWLARRRVEAVADGWLRFLVRDLLAAVHERAVAVVLDLLQESPQFTQDVEGIVRRLGGKPIAALVTMSSCSHAAHATTSGGHIWSSGRTGFTSVSK